MTNDDFDLFRNARQHKFLGGVAKKSPIRLTIPKDAHWHVVVDMEGHPGQGEILDPGRTEAKSACWSTLRRCSLPDARRDAGRNRTQPRSRLSFAQ